MSFQDFATEGASEAGVSPALAASPLATMFAGFTASYFVCPNALLARLC